MRALVTGARGFVGRHLCTRLGSQAETVTGDIREPKTFEGLSVPDVVYHLAAQSNVPASYKDPEGTWAANVEGTRNLLDWARQARPARIVLVSSAHVYGRPRIPRVDEDQPLAPVSPYGATKMAMEAAGRWYASSTGLEVVLVRPFNLYGPGQGPGFLIPDILNQVQAGQRVVLGDPKPIRDYTFISDAVEFLVRAGQRREAAGSTLNLGSGTGHSVADVAKAAMEAAGSDGVPWHDPSRFRKDEVAEMVADAGRAQRLLGWQPEVGLAEGLRRTWADWR